jgi:ElaB/YqjD/DUF883 family membrane-anchored ribosome-binding protein
MIDTGELFNSAATLAESELQDFVTVSEEVLRYMRSTDKDTTDAEKEAEEILHSIKKELHTRFSK